MFITSGTLAFYGLAHNRAKLRELYTFHPVWVLVGCASAVILYLLFFVGDKVAASLFEFTGSQIAGIYRTKAQASPLLIGSLLLFWIGPGEEIFWRGFVQQRFSEMVGPWRGYIITSAIYAGVHVWAFNVMLVLAALICGLFWGWMFLKYKSVWPGLISHAVWDVTIFVLFPLR